MNEAAVLAEMRDIHLPADLSAAGPPELSPWPILGLVAIVGAMALARFWQRFRRRQAARAELARIAGLENRTLQWERLLTFAVARAGHGRPLPGFVYRNPDTVSDPERAALIDFLYAELR